MSASSPLLLALVIRTIMGIAWDNVAGNDGRQSVEIAVPKITQDGAIFSDVGIIENIVVDNADGDEKWRGATTNALQDACTVIASTGPDCLFWPEHPWGDYSGFFVSRYRINLFENIWGRTIERKRQIFGFGISIVPQFSKILSYNLAILPFSGWPCSWIFDKNKCSLTSSQSSVGLFESAPLKTGDYDKDRSKKTYVSNHFEWLENLTYFSPNNIAQLRFIFGTVIGVLGFAYALASFRQGWLLRFCLGIAFFFFGLSLASASPLSPFRTYRD
jgi:hypothetical protein